MNLKPLSALDARIQLTGLLIEEVEEEYPSLEDGADRLHSVLTVYEQMLLRTKHKRATDFR